jgi:aspartate aminotransferase
MKRLEGPRGFPLGEWVAAHPAVRHNLSLSGMAGTLRSVPRLLRDPPAARPEELRAMLSEIHGVDSSHVFLTHGAHEANFLALSFLSGEARRRGRELTVRVDVPEYPPLIDLVRATGNLLAAQGPRPDAWLLSNPNNPTGRLRTARDVVEGQEAIPTIIVDEAYREFTDAPSLASVGAENLWVTGTFTKVYGADQIRVGWSIPPAARVADYARFHPIASDEVSERSVRSAVAILSARTEVLREVHRTFSRNVQALLRAVPETPPPRGPVWFDRGGHGLPGDAVQAAALRRSVLVSSGRFFGDPRGVRVCLSRRSFPADLLQYLTIRNRFVSGREPGSDHGATR